jgi:hypothetical protein
MHQRRDAEPRLLEQEFLNLICQLCRFDGAEAAAAGQARHLTQAVRQARLRPFSV